MAEVTSKSMCNIFSWSRFGIQLTQSRFQLIKFGDSERRQVRKPERYEDVVVGIANILVIKNNNCLLFKNNIEYAWARFMQTSKITKRSMTIFFTNPDLAPMREHLSYKNADKMKVLLIELPYSKVT